MHGGTTEEGNCSYLLPLSHRAMHCITHCCPIMWEIFTVTFFSQKDHGDIIKWQHFPDYWLFVRGIHRSPVNSPHKGQWRGALIFSLICAWINCWVNNGEAGHLRHHRAHYDVIVMYHILCLSAANCILSSPAYKIIDMDIMTSWYGNEFRITGPEDSTHKGAVMRTLDVSFVASVIQLLNK